MACSTPPLAHTLPCPHPPSPTPSLAHTALQLQAAEERAALLAEQAEQEAALRAAASDEREAELAARWERALEAAQGERAALQQALDAANRQLAGAHRDMEALRHQVHALRLAEPAQQPQVQPQPSHGSSGSSRRQAALPGLAPAATGSLAGDGDESVQETASPSGSHDVFSELPAASRDVFSELQPPEPHLQQQLRQQQHQHGSSSGQGASAAAPAASSAYQRQLHQHIDTLAGKLSTFQQAVEEARQVGHRASQQVRRQPSQNSCVCMPRVCAGRWAAVCSSLQQSAASAGALLAASPHTSTTAGPASSPLQLAESRSMLPAELQRRQAAVADAQLQAVRAAERQQFEAERRRLDAQLAEQQRLLAEREAELQRLQRAEDEQRRRLQEEAEEEARRRRRQQQLQAEEERRRHEAATQAGAAAAATSHSAAYHSLLGPSGAASQAASYGQRRSVGAALAAVGAQPPPAGSPAAARYSVAPAAPAAAPTASYASSHRGTAAGAADVAPLQLSGRSNGRLQVPGMGASGSSSPALRPVLGSFAAAPPAGTTAPAPAPAGAAAAAAAAGEDPLARARRQVLAAKDYLRQVAAMGPGGAGS